MSSNHHRIKAELHPNLLKNNKDTYKAQTLAYQTLGIKDICASLTNKPGTGIDPDTMEYHVRLFLEEMGELLADGFAVNTGYFLASASIRGSFKFKNDNFDSERHSVTFKFTQGAVLRKKATETQAEILHVVTNNYGIQQVRDNHTNSENDLLTPGNALHIKGVKLKLTGLHPDEGIYFISETSGDRAKVATCDFIVNQNSQLLIVIPDLQPDSYHLEHITLYAGKGKPLTEPRRSTFVRILRVV
jgi:hypothetical protein